MLSNSSSLQPDSTLAIPILAQKSADRCHVLLPDSATPTSAILCNGDFYVYVKFFPTLESAHRGANRLIDRGNAVMLTRIPKGLVLWVLEREAQLIQKSPTWPAKTEKYIQRPESTDK